MRLISFLIWQWRTKLSALDNRFKTVAFLHSPFLISRRVLKYILAYHIVPNVSFFSDYSSNSTALAPYKIGQSFNLDSNITHYELPTLLSASGYNDNATLLVDVISYKSLGGKGPIKRDVIILPHKGEENDRKDSKVVAVWKADAPARHGAIHVGFPTFASSGCEILPFYDVFRRSTLSSFLPIIDNLMT